MTITGPGTGTVRNIAFTGMENLVGAPASDYFTVDLDGGGTWNLDGGGDPGFDVLVLAAAGNLAHEDVLALAERHFADLTGGQRFVDMQPSLTPLALSLPPERKPGQVVGEGADAVPALLRLLREEAKVI